MSVSPLSRRPRYYTAGPAYIPAWRAATDAPWAVIRESRRDDIRFGFEATKEELDLARLLERLPDEAVFERS